MEIQILHFYPDLMSLYGSYANISVLRRYLEQLGNCVHVTAVRPEEDVNFSDVDFLYMGAGTERAQKAALADFRRHGETVRALAADGVGMLFAGTAMELLGECITDAENVVHEGIALAAFTSVQGRTRYVEDVYGHTDVCPEAIVGFMNKCTLISGVETPLLSSLEMGFGNDRPRGPEGFHWNNVFASELTGPLLVKNPHLLDVVGAVIYVRRGIEFPTERPRDSWAEAAYAVTAEQLRLR